MKCLWLGWLVFGGMLGAGALLAGTQDSEFNVNMPTPWKPSW